MRKAVVVTGAMGGIGSAICKVLRDKEYDVIGIDLRAIGPIENCKFTVQIDLERLVSDTSYRANKLGEFDAFGVRVFALINNAATQLLNGFEEIQNDWHETMAVNLTAPLILSQFFLKDIEVCGGSIINIASIHSILTKPRFISYATSKSALIGLTKAMAVDLQGRIRVNAISPAAIETDMLKAGFNDDLGQIEKLYKLHPVQRIGYPEEVAKLVVFLMSEESKFINGANLQLDGGISSVYMIFDTLFQWFSNSHGDFEELVSPW